MNQRFCWRTELNNGMDYDIIPVLKQGTLEIEFLSDCDPISQDLQLESVSLDGILVSPSEAQKFFEWYYEELEEYAWERLAMCYEPED